MSTCTQSSSSGIVEISGCMLHSRQEHPRRYGSNLSTLLHSCTVKPFVSLEGDLSPVVLTFEPRVSLVSKK